MARRVERLGITQIATVLGTTEHQAYKAVRRWEHVYAKAPDGTYDARILDLLRALRDLPHRALEPVHSDWLARFQKEHHAPSTTTSRHGPRRGCPEP